MSSIGGLGLGGVIYDVNQRKGFNKSKETPPLGPS